MCLFIPWWLVPRRWVYGRGLIFVSERTNKRQSINLAASAALVALSLPRLLLSTPTGVTKASTTNTTLSPSSFSLLNTPKSPPPTTTPRDFFSASLSSCWERTGIFLRRALHLEDCCFAFVFLCVCVWRARSTSFRYQMVLPFV